MNIDDYLLAGEQNRKLKGYQSKKEKAKTKILEAFETHDKPYLSMSGGKDSVAMAFLVNEVANEVGKEFVLWSHMSNASFPGTKEIVCEVAERTGRKLIISENDLAYSYYAKKKKAEFGKTGVFFDEVRNFAKDYDLAFVGVRAYESKRRMRSARVHGQLFHSRDMGDVDVSHPLLWFKIIDVFSLLVEYKAPLHPIYFKQGVETYRNTLDGDPFIRLGYTTAKDIPSADLFIKLNYPEIWHELRSAAKQEAKQ